MTLMVQDLYVIQMGKTGAFKVGRSRCPKERLLQLQTGCPYPLRLILVLPGQGHLEPLLHRKLERGKTHGGEEWFDYDVLPELPVWIYEQIDLDVANWWWCGGIPKLEPTR
jgi:hypothetical protein